MMTIDFASELGKRTLNDLQTSHAIWFTTVGHSSQTPQPNVVWFVYEEGDVLVYTRPNAVRLENIRHNPRVSLNFDSPNQGSNMAVLTGTAEIDPTIRPVIENQAYLDKYPTAITGLGMTPQQYSDTYRVPIRIRLDNLRGW